MAYNKCATKPDCNAKHGTNECPSQTAATPLAFASVSIDGTKQSGTSNVSTAYNKSTKHYEITICGVQFTRGQYTAVATMSGWNGTPLFINTDGSDGKLLVDLRDSGGHLAQADFQVVVLKGQ
jgi:hypothetical protein